MCYEHLSVIFITHEQKLNHYTFYFASRATTNFSSNRVKITASHVQRCNNLQKKRQEKRRGGKQNRTIKNASICSDSRLTISLPSPRLDKPSHFDLHNAIATHVRPPQQRKNRQMLESGRSDDNWIYLPLFFLLFSLPFDCESFIKVLCAFRCHPSIGIPERIEPFFLRRFKIFLLQFFSR